MMLRSIGPVLRGDTTRDGHPVPQSSLAAPPPTQHEPVDDGPCLLLELPAHVLLEVLRCLDIAGLCALAQTCRALHDLCGAPTLWPGKRLGGPLVRALRFAVADILHVPPQILHVRLEDGRSSKFPLALPLHNLRAVLGAPDVEALAERTSCALQDRIDRVPAALLYHPASAAFSGGRGDGSSHGAGSGGGSEGGGGGGSSGGKKGGGGGSPSYAALAVCRADRGSVRVGLQPGVAVARTLYAAAAASAAAAAAEPSVFTARSATCTAAALSEAGASLSPGSSSGCGAGRLEMDLLGALLAMDCGAPREALVPSEIATSPGGGGAGGAAAAAVATTAAEREDRALRMLEGAAAGDAAALEAWREFATGCRQVATAGGGGASRPDADALAAGAAAARL